MNKKAITHLIVDTTSSNEHYNGHCDYALIPMTPRYVAHLLEYLVEVARMHATDDSILIVERWDGTPSYFRFNEKLEGALDVDGNLAIIVPRGEPILLGADPEFDDQDFQRVECQTAQVGTDAVWWTAYVKHTDVRIETARIGRDTLLEIQRRFPHPKGRYPSAASTVVHPALHRIHDLLYLDMTGGEEFYNPDKEWDADVMTMVAEIVAEYIPRP